MFTANTAKDNCCCTLPGLFPWVDPRPLLCFMQIVVSSCYSGAALENSPKVQGHAVLPGQGLGLCSWGAHSVLGVAPGQQGKGGVCAKSWLEAHSGQAGPVCAACRDCAQWEEPALAPRWAWTRPEHPRLSVVLADGCYAGSEEVPTAAGASALAKCPSVPRAVLTTLPVLHPAVQRGEEEILVATLDATGPGRREPRGWRLPRVHGNELIYPAVNQQSLLGPQCIACSSLLGCQHLNSGFYCHAAL